MKSYSAVFSTERYIFGIETLTSWYELIRACFLIKQIEEQPLTQHPKKVCCLQSLSPRTSLWAKPWLSHCINESSERKREKDRQSREAGERYEDRTKEFCQQQREAHDDAYNKFQQQTPPASDLRTCKVTRDAYAPTYKYIWVHMTLARWIIRARMHAESRELLLSG